MEPLVFGVRYMKLVLQLRATFCNKLNLYSMGKAPAYMEEANLEFLRSNMQWDLEKREVDFIEYDESIYINLEARWCRPIDNEWHWLLFMHNDCVVSF